MKPMVIYSPNPPVNDYLAIKYFQSLLDYSRKTSNPINLIESLDDVGNCIVLSDSFYLKPEKIIRLKENGNTIIAFDINDSSYLSESYRDSRHSFDIDLIFKVAGVQIVSDGIDLFISTKLDFTKRIKIFAHTPNQWENYQDAYVLSLPYVPWNCYSFPAPSWDERIKQGLVRGGNHFHRYLLYLMLLKHNLVSEHCSFLTNDYFLRSMAEQFKYCPECINIKEAFRWTSYAHYVSNREHYRQCCNSPVKWGEGIAAHYFNESIGQWNNRCPNSFYWLTELFQEKYGEIDMVLVEKALNGILIPDKSFYEILSKHLFYADYKWIFSIYAPPRFWEAACAKTINVVPKRTGEQIYFPKMIEGDHYLTFEEDFSNIEELREITREQYEHITEKTYQLFMDWIMPTEHRISNNLINHILTKIEEVT